MEKIELLLEKIAELHSKAEVERHIREKQGEFFNVFNTIGLRTEEVRLHSAFIAELLNPHGKHGLSHLFLEAFLRLLDLPFDYLIFSKVSKNNKERYIGRVTETEGGRIDIIIEDGYHAVIIENKIFAEDQKNQMVRYYNYGKKKFPNGFNLIYMTLDGHEPDDSSLDNKKFTYDCLSYNSNIVEWLEECILIADEKPLVKSVIIQYKELVKQITNTDMDTKYSEQLLDMMTKPQNAIAVGEILSIQDDWFDNIINKYIWEPLEQFATDKDMKFGIEKECGGLWIYKKEWKHYGLYVWTDRKNDWLNMYVGISDFDNPKRTEKILKKEYQKFECLKEQPCDCWPYGWEYLRSDIKDWNCYITKEIISGTVVNYIKEKFEMILQEIEGRNIKMP